MKKSLSLAAFLMMIAGSALGGQYPYVGLYAGIIDPDTGVEGPGGYDHSQCSVSVPMPFTDIEMWIWWLPDPQLGLIACEFKILYPSATYVTQGPVTANPLNTTEIGNLSSGIACTVDPECQHDWYWSHHQTLTLKTTAPSGFIQIVPDEFIEFTPIAIASCEAGFPVYICTNLNNLALNRSCQIAVEDKSWGAIKSLYR